MENWPIKCAAGTGGSPEKGIIPDFVPVESRAGCAAWTTATCRTRKARKCVTNIGQSWDFMPALRTDFDEQADVEKKAHDIVSTTEYVEGDVQLQHLTKKIN